MSTAQAGDTTDSPAEVQMRLSRAPFAKMSRIFKHAKADVVIQEVSPGDDSTLQELYSGRLGKLLVKPDGANLLGRAKILGVKARLNASCGIQALDTCNWIFGQSPCGFNLNVNKINGTIAELNTDGHPTRVKITLVSPPSMTNVRWNRGSISIDGLSITIRKSFNDAVYKFDLREVPPPEWLGASCILTPGCDKKYTTCTVHGQTENHLAPGIKMLDYNPNFSQG